MVIGISVTKIIVTGIMTTAAGNSRKAYAIEVMSIVGEPRKRAKIEVALTFDDSN